MQTKTDIQHSVTSPFWLLRHYSNYMIGTFVLYKSLSRLFEVHVRQWDCDSHHTAIACNCGVVALEDNDIVIVDMCNRQFLETKSQVIIQNIRASSQQNVKILKSYGGKKITVCISPLFSILLLMENKMCKWKSKNEVIFKTS